MHRVLGRQLRKLGLEADQPPDPAAWEGFLALVDAVYANADQDRYLIERAMEVSSAEMEELHGRLAGERDRLHSTIASLGEGLAVLAADCTVVMMNPAGVRILTGHLAGGSGDCDRSEEEARGVLRGVLSAGCQMKDQLRPGDSVVLDDIEVYRADGSRRTLSLTVTPVWVGGGVDGAVCAFRDVTNKRHEEAELLHARKLEAVGRLAAGVAHEINTPIQFVGDNIHFLREAFVDLLGLVDVYRSVLAGEKDRDSVEDAEDAAGLGFVREEVPVAFAETLHGVERVSSIVKAMKAFGHPDGEVPKPIDVNEIVVNTLTVARGAVKSVAHVDVELGEVSQICGFAGDVNQVLLNLIVNAADAIEDRGDGPAGLIRVKTWCDGGAVAIEVADNGAGIPDAIRDRVFDPFFTTKDIGRGTGQGLSLARSLVCERHGGTLTFESVAGEGTTFSVRLPAGTADA